MTYVSVPADELEVIKVPPPISPPPVLQEGDIVRAIMSDSQPHTQLGVVVVAGVPVPRGTPDMDIDQDIDVIWWPDMDDQLKKAVKDNLSTRLQPGEPHRIPSISRGINTVYANNKTVKLILDAGDQDGTNTDPGKMKLNPQNVEIWNQPPPDEGGDSGSTGGDQQPPPEQDQEGGGDDSGGGSGGASGDQPPQPKQPDDTGTGGAGGGTGDQPQTPQPQTDTPSDTGDPSKDQPDDETPDEQPQDDGPTSGGDGGDATGSGAGGEQDPTQAPGADPTDRPDVDMTGSEEPADIDDLTEPEKSGMGQALDDAEDGEVVEAPDDNQPVPKDQMVPKGQQLSDILKDIDAEQAGEPDEPDDLDDGTIFDDSEDEDDDDETEDITTDQGPGGTPGGPGPDDEDLDEPPENGSSGEPDLDDEELDNILPEDEGDEDLLSDKIKDVLEKMEDEAGESIGVNDEIPEDRKPGLTQEQLDEIIPDEEGDLDDDDEAAIAEDGADEAVEDLRSSQDEIREEAQEIEKLREEGGDAAVAKMVGSGSRGSGSGMSLLDEPEPTFPQLMRQVVRWIKMLKGKGGLKSVYRSDMRSKRIEGLFGRDTEEKEKKKSEKVLVFLFDTSGSMDRNLMMKVCNDIIIHLTKDKTVDKVLALDVDGFTVSGYYIDTKKAKPAIAKVLRSGSGSLLEPGTRKLLRILKQNKKKAQTISGMVIISDFQFFDNPRPVLPPELVKYKMPVLAMLVNSSQQYLDNFVDANPQVAISRVAINKSKVTEIKLVRPKKR